MIMKKSTSEGTVAALLNPNTFQSNNKPQIIKGVNYEP